jgi:hypothetical protein
LGPAWCWRKRGVRSGEHAGELAVAPSLLAALPLRGKVVTADALYCERTFCERVLAGGGDYLLIVKGNRQRLYADITLLFAQPPPGEVFARAQQGDRHGDRWEQRRLWASTGLCEYLHY